MRFLSVFLVAVLILPIVLAASCPVRNISFPVKVSLTAESSTTRYVDMTSESGGEATFRLVNTSLHGVTLDAYSLTFGPGEVKQVKVTFNATALSPGIYVGAIIAEGSVDSYTPVIAEIESPQVDVHANLDIPPIYTSRAPGEQLVFQGTLYDVANPSNTEPHDVKLKTVLYSCQGTLFYEDEESIVLTDITRFTKTLPLPDCLECDTYVLATIVKSGDSVGVSSRTFTIAQVEKSAPNFSIIALVALASLIVLAAIVFLILQVRKYR